MAQERAVGTGLRYVRSETSIKAVDRFTTPNSPESWASHYPYDCNKPHCPAIAGACMNACCRVRIDARFADLQPIVQKKQQEKRQLQEKIRAWADKLEEEHGESIEFVVLKTTCKASLTLRRLQLHQEEDAIGVVDIACYCRSCSCEKRRRISALLDVGIGLLHAKNKSLQEHFELRQREKARTQYVQPQFLDA